MSMWDKEQRPGPSQRLRGWGVPPPQTKRAGAKLPVLKLHHKAGQAGLRGAPGIQEQSWHGGVRPVHLLSSLRGGRGAHNTGLPPSGEWQRCVRSWTDQPLPHWSLTSRPAWELPKPRGPARHSPHRGRSRAATRRVFQSWPRAQSGDTRRVQHSSWTYSLWGTWGADAAGCD